MALQRIRGASVFIAGKKVGQFEGAKYNIASGDEPQFGDPGGIGYSDGAMTTKLSATGCVPVAGMDVDLTTYLVKKNYVDVSISLINGKIHQLTMRVLTADFTSSQKSGTLMGDFELGGFDPNITG